MNSASGKRVVPWPRMSRIQRVARPLAPGLLIALPAIVAVVRACTRASFSTIGRDQGIFQYIGWAATHGVVLYRDVRDVNGPLVPLVHVVMLALGGDDEHRFRVLDLVFTALAAAFAGGSLVALVKRKASVLSLAAAGVVTIVAQYINYGWWDTAQRESFFDWFVLVSVGLQIVGSTLLRNQNRRGLVLLAMSGAFSIVPWFGKPTFAFFTAGQLAVLLYDDLPLSRVRRIWPVVVGGAIGALPPLLFLLTYGDVRAWARISFVDVPAMYRFIWPRTFVEIVGMAGNGAFVATGAIAAMFVGLFVATKIMPRRALVLAVMPLAGLLSVAVQAKGFRYHFHPITAGAALAAVAVVHAGWERGERRTWSTLAAGAVAIGLGAYAFVLANSDLYASLPTTFDKAARDAPERLALFERVDFFPNGLRDAAAHIDAHTKPTDTVQTYGMDPYVLFLAQRRSATPYIYAYDLDVDAARHGGYEGGAKPDEAQVARIDAMRAEHERDLLARMKSAPPAAFVFLDKSPLLAWEDAEVDFREHCPEAYEWLRATYLESASFDGIHVWLRVADVFPQDALSH